MQIFDFSYIFFRMPRFEIIKAVIMVKISDEIL